MAYSLITPFKSSDGTTVTLLAKTSAMAKLTTAGVYIKTGGASRIDPSRLIFVVTRNSSAGTDGLLTLISGSTDGNGDYFPGAYSTLNNLNITVQQSGTQTAGISGRNSAQYIFIGDVAKYMDTDDYIKFIGAADITSKANGTVGTRIGAIYVGRGGH